MWPRCSCKLFSLFRKEQSTLQWLLFQQKHCVVGHLSTQVVWYTVDLDQVNRVPTPPLMSCWPDGYSAPIRHWTLAEESELFSKPLQVSGWTSQTPAEKNIYRNVLVCSMMVQLAPPIVSQTNWHNLLSTVWCPRLWAVHLFWHTLFKK